ncbi:hypothetical protein Htur_2016 [Haloterrigena turkmenica DSM 5511]|uniref:C2H2-type domain-containing protein n=2 Tax=Haloterrigena turkmenica TaxID=62320 RepID=D2RT20_HALTV|nr:hypothetical protein Htur_2016 [Haloterrigena turkmenica DSM 5511]
MRDERMHAASICLEPTESKQMPYEPPVECPLCRETLELDQTLETHLVGSHTQREVARYLASLHERVQPRSVSN